MKTYSHTHDYLVRLLKEYSPLKKDLSVVDYGCGSGALIPHLSEFKLKKYFGMDVNVPSIKEAKKHYSHQKNYRFMVIKPNDCPSFGMANSVDAVMLVGVWQYLTPKEQKYIARESQRVLRKNGLLLVSCAVDHWVYRLFNLYRLFIPHHYVDRLDCITTLKKARLKVVYQREGGIFLNPLFSNVIVFFFDIVDQLIFRSRGTLGPVGQWARRTAHPLLALEHQLPIDYGYTLFLIAKK